MRLSVARFMPVTNNKRYRPRRYNLKFSNSWHINNELTVKDVGYRKACEERGIHVLKPEDVIRPYLPEPKETYNVDEFLSKKALFGEIKRKVDHPFYHERPAYTFNKITWLIRGSALNHAKVLCNAVEVESGLPQRIKDLSASLEVSKEAEYLLSNTVKDARLFDAVQKQLPKNVATPNIGWNPVLDTMFRPLPYEVTPETPSWGYNVRREYGVPIKRKNLSIVRGLFRCCDLLSNKYPHLLHRLHQEESVLRQFLEKDNKLLRIHAPMAYLTTDTKPVTAYADQQTVDSTFEMDLPDLTPLNSLTHFSDDNVYRFENNFPIKESVKTSGCPSHIHTCVELNNSHIPNRIEEDYQGRSLIMAFGAALGQARLLYGENVTGVLPEPVTIHFVNSDGHMFHFSVFQLNTLDLDSHEKGEGGTVLKNIFWHQPQMEPLYEICDYVQARPKLKGLNLKVLQTLMAMYLQNVV